MISSATYKVWKPPTTKAVATPAPRAVCDPMTSRSEKEVELVHAMARGDSGPALNAFYDRYAGVVMALLVRMLGSRSEAEELLQEVFVELWWRAGQYDAQRAGVSTWVATVARSRALDALRARRRRAKDREVEADDVPLEAPENLRPDEIASANQRRDAVHRAMEALNPEQRQVLELSYFGGLSHSEIAERIRIPVGTVKSRILAGMKILRAALDPDRQGDLR